MNAALKSIPLAIPLAITLLLSACTSDQASTGQRTNPVRTDANSTEGIEFTYKTSPLEIQPDERIELNESNAPEFARLALGKAVAFTINGISNAQNLAAIEDFFRNGPGDISDTCGSGGTVRVVSTDQNGNGAIEKDDTLSIIFDGCNGADGSLHTRFVRYDGSAINGAVSTDHYITADKFRGTQPSTGSSGEEDGTSGRRIILGNGRFQYIVHGPTTKVKETEGGRGSADYTSVYHIDVQGALGNANQDTRVRVNYKDKGDSSTRLDLPATGAYTAQTENLVVVAADNAASGGQIDVRSGGRLIVKPLGKGSGRYRVEVGLDANNDGSVEKTCTFDYASLMSGDVSFSDDTCAGRAVTDVIPAPLVTVPVLSNILKVLPPALRPSSRRL